MGQNDKISALFEDLKYFQENMFMIKPHDSNVLLYENR